MRLGKGQESTIDHKRMKTRWSPTNSRRGIESLSSMEYSWISICVVASTAEADGLMRAGMMRADIMTFVIRCGNSHFLLSVLRAFATLIACTSRVARAHEPSGSQPVKSSRSAPRMDRSTGVRVYHHRQKYLTPHTTQPRDF